MNKKIILPIAIIASLPFVANAENISGAMYAAPVHETQQTPAPTTNSYSPFGRVNIDTDDQDHIATTAYVKGAYNSTIAAVNQTNERIDVAFEDLGVVEDGKQDKLHKSESNDEIDSEILDEQIFDEYARSGFMDDWGFDMSSRLVTAQGVATGINGFVYGRNGPLTRVYTTWGNDSASIGVSMEPASFFQ